MNNSILSIIVIALSLTTMAANTVSTDSQGVSLKTKGEIQVKVIETVEACVFTYDPQWADEEDTREARTIFDNYKETQALLKGLQTQGFSFAGFQNKETCEVENSSFPEVLTSTDSLYFARFVSPVSMAKAARAQKAFKTVRRVYVKGFNEISADLKKIKSKEDSIFKTIPLKK